MPPPNGIDRGVIGGLAKAAAHGSSLTTLQTVINKLATVVALWVVAWRLGPDEFGISSLAIALGMYLMVLPPMTVGDVLIAHQNRYELVRHAARRMALTVGGVTALVIALIAPLLARANPEYPPFTLTALLWVIALRPIGEALCPIALADLRRDLRYRAIALADGSIQIAATITTVVMALAGANAFALVVPQVVATFVKALCYARAAGRHGACPPLPQWMRARVARFMWRDYALAAIAQYAHNVVIMLPIVVLGYLSNEDETGFYSFAFMLSAQANTVIASQLGTVLQPIFGRLGADPARQLAGFTRVLRALGAIAIPLTLVQAALAVPLFHVAFAERWQPAIGSFAVLSVLEGFYFATAPTMSMLRAQRRFATYFAWQVSHLIMAATLFAFVATAGGAFGVSCASLGCWMVSLPIAVWLCGRTSGLTLGQSVATFARPWMLAAPAAAGVWWLSAWLDGMGTAGQVFALAVAGPLAVAVCWIGMRWTQPAVWADLAPIIESMLARLRTRVMP